MMTVEELQAHYKSVRQRMTAAAEKAAAAAKIRKKEADRAVLEKQISAALMARKREEERKQYEAEKIKETLQKYAEEQASKPSPYRMKMLEVARQYGYDVDLVIGRSSNCRVMRARYEMIYELREMGLSFARIGQMMGGRCHTACLAAYKKFKRKREREIRNAERTECRDLVAVERGENCV